MLYFWDNVKVNIPTFFCIINTTTKKIDRSISYNRVDTFFDYRPLFIR